MPNPTSTLLPMNARPLVFAILLATVLAISPPARAQSGTDAGSDSDSEKTLLAHYMPWYASKPVSGRWGWHWTMGKFNPDSALKNGWPEAASHDRPLMGLYDSHDPDALECQVLQMKLAGIDGVIIDWYGTHDYFDYAEVHRNTRALIPWLEKAGLKFAICYEDQTVGKMIEGSALKASDAVAHGREVLQWVEKNWFTRDSYLHHRHRPVFLTFGPQHFAPEEWQRVTGSFTTDPWIHALPHLAEKFAADGPFGWPPVSGGNALTPDDWRKYLDQLYQRSGTGKAVVAVAFPGFEDIYQQAGLHDSYGSIAPRDGKTFAETLDLAFASDSALIQIATWNDYGEGTAIEPTERHGYRYLEEVQRRAVSGFSASDLRQPLRLFQLRKKLDPGLTQQLDAIAGLLFAGEVAAAERALSAAKQRDASPQP